MKEKTVELKEKIEKDYKDMMAVINSTSLPLFVEDTIEDMHILIETLIAKNKELKEENQSYRDYLGNPPCYDDAKYIPKSKVEEVIREYKKKGNSVGIPHLYGAEIELLQSLLGKE